MKKNEFNFENEISIDLDDLHTEWQTHSQVRYKYASEVSFLDRVLKKMNEEIAIVKSTLIKEYKIKNVKATVQQTEAFCISHIEYIQVRDKQIDIEYDLNMAKNALKAFDDRKTALENEVKLWGANYFSAPNEDRTIKAGKSIAGKSIADKGRDKITQNARSTMNRTKIKKDF